MNKNDPWYYEYLRYEREKVILKCAEYCIDYNMSLREIAENLCIGKTTAHKYLTKELKYLDDDLYIQCKYKLRKNQQEQAHKRDSGGRFCK